MTAVVRNLDADELDQILDRAIWLPRGATADDSRTADKFVVRAYQELFDEINRLAVLQLRSKNSECVVAILDSLDGRARSTASLEVLAHYVGHHLGNDILTKLLESVPEFTLGQCSREDKFVIRFPEEVRGSIVQYAAEDKEPMVVWVRKALVYWINNQRKQHALTSVIAAITTAQEKE